MAALFDCEWAGEPDSNYGWSGVSIYQANGTDTGEPVGLLVQTLGDQVVPDVAVSQLIASLQTYLNSKAAAAEGADPRPFHDGRSTYARLSRWVLANVPDRRIYADSGTPVVMTGGQLYDLLGQVADRSYHWGTDDVTQPGWDD